MADVKNVGGRPKVLEHPKLTLKTDLGDSADNPSITVDLSEVLIVGVDDFIREINKLREHYIPKPLGVWINLNQAYSVTKEVHGHRETREMLEKIAFGTEELYGYKIWITGRDA